MATITLFDLSTIDGPTVRIDANGKIVVQPSGQRGGGPGFDDAKTNDVKHVALIMKHAIGIHDHEVRDAVIRATADYLIGDRIFGPGSNIVLIMNDDHGPNPTVVKPPPGGPT